MFNYPRLLSDYASEGLLKLYFRLAVMHGVCVQQNKHDAVHRSLYHSYRLGFYVAVMGRVLVRPYSKTPITYADVYDMIAVEAQRILKI